jgi:hypothetical protein
MFQEVQCYYAVTMKGMIMLFKINIYRTVYSLPGPPSVDIDALLHSSGFDLCLYPANVHTCTRNHFRVNRFRE